MPRRDSQRPTGRLEVSVVLLFVIHERDVTGSYTGKSKSSLTLS